MAATDYELSLPGFFIVIVFGSDAQSTVTLLSFHLPIPLLQITLTAKIQWNQLPAFPMQFALQIRLNPFNRYMQNPTHANTLISY